MLSEQIVCTYSPLRRLRDVRERIAGASSFLTELCCELAAGNGDVRLLLPPQLMMLLLLVDADATSNKQKLSMYQPFLGQQKHVGLVLEKSYGSSSRHQLGYQQQLQQQQQQQKQPYIVAIVGREFTAQLCEKR